MRVLSSTVDGATGADLELFYVPDGDTTIWHRVLDGETIVSDTDTGEPAPPVEDFTPPPAPEVVAAQAIQAEIDARLAPSSVNSIAEIKAAIRDGLAAAVAQLAD